MRSSGPGFLRRPGPELRIVSLDAAEILAA